MTGRGSLTSAPTRRLRWMLGAHALWLALLGVLGAWWSRFALRQSMRITELERLLGLAREGESQWVRTQRMMYWESLSFVALMLLSLGIMVYLYIREERRARALQAFFASVTHELRTPLTSIRLQAESLADGDPSPELIRRLLEDTQRLESQVERTLELARVEGGGPVHIQNIRLRLWIERTIASWQETHANRLDLDLDIADVQVTADTSAISVILRNLLENSIRHSGKDRVRVSLSTEMLGERVLLRVTDDGRGLSPEHVGLGKLFHKGPQSQGAGVGLYLIRVLMEKMGGDATFHGDGRFEARLIFRGGQSNVA